jgi:hypothetical protein
MPAGKHALPQGGFDGAPLTPRAGVMKDVWLHAETEIPGALLSGVDVSAFRLLRPVWTYNDRLFFVVRFEPQACFDPIRTASEVEGVPECHQDEQYIKCGIDLAPLNMGLKAWINGDPCRVYPACAPWRRFRPNSRPVVAFFFEAGSRLQPDAGNSVVLFARHMDAAAFRGIVMEHAPEGLAEQTLELP